MFYSAPDLANAQTILQNKVASDSSMFLPDMTSIPNFDQFSSKLFSLLPENMLSINNGGIVDAFNLKNINTNIEGGLSNIASDLQQNASSMFKSAVGNFPINPAGAESFGQLSSSASKISSSSQMFSKKTSDQMIAVFKNNSQASQLGNLNYAMNNSLASSSRLSPKGIRDLNDPNLFNKKTDAAVSNASSSLKDASTKMVEQVAENKVFSNSAQTNLQQLSMPQYSGNNAEGFDLYVRRTVYWAYGSGTDIDSANLKSSTGRQLEQGTSVAVDPSIIPYLSKIQFPDIGVRYATDTGGAVKARTASAGTVPIIDLFFLYKEDALAFAKSSPPYITVKVYPPQSKYKYVANSAPTYGVA